MSLLAKIYFTGDHVARSEFLVDRTLVCQPLSGPLM
jgi:hypothetical protein